MIYDRLNMQPTVKTVGGVVGDMQNVKTGGLDISPEYQRDYIWSNEFKDQLILSIILNYPIGNIVINNLDHPNKRNARQELVDGKQRLTTIMRFKEGRDADNWLNEEDTWCKLSKKNSEQAKEIIGKIIGDNDPEGKERMNKATRLGYNDLPESISRNFDNYNISVYTMQAADPEQIRDYFKVLQNQEKLKAGEIINALPHSYVSPYFDQADGDGFLRVLGCNYRRGEFEKLYYSMLGLWFGKMQINTADKTVINFVENLSDLTDEQRSIVRELNAGINRIASLNYVVPQRRTNRRTIKLLLGIALERPEYFVDDNTLLTHVCQVCDLASKLAAFNSSDSDGVRFARYFSDEYTSDRGDFERRREPMYRQIFSAASRGTSKGDFQKAIRTMLAMFTMPFDEAYERYTQNQDTV
ncbi:DUF262 domain-containing protein [Bifidobacterium sp. B4142]|uniref:DUF262 domain-containing protein n=1 Tax=Bifidobacterium sp. B4142 TaxID=2817962 RepID=UPI00226B0C96|nr:DUF262 domain-containing protein [Bifidobacterium sp. B4142]MCX8686576.1 DUF262 domain-containing protein [Bifidobacterium sp. B4142]